MNINCIYKKNRQKDYQYYIYCSHPNIKSTISTDNCYKCEFKEYKSYKPMSTKKKKRTQATSINIGTKNIVWERDNHKCIFCGKNVPLFNANAHLIKRSQGGLGIPENIFTACDECHYEEDMGKNSQELEIQAEQYLHNYYGTSWNKNNLIYRKEI